MILSENRYPLFSESCSKFVPIDGIESHPILAQGCQHAHECDPLVSIREDMTFREAKAIGGGELRQLRLLIVPFVDRPFGRGAQQIFISPTWRSTETPQQPAVNGDDLFVGQPRRDRV
jgi:hypothetical protein